MAGCLVFSDPINSPPTVSLAAPSDPIVRGRSAVFVANAVDPDQGTDTLEFDWYRDRTCDRAKQNPAELSGPGRVTFSVYPTDMTPGCIVVVVTDKYGASASASQTYEVVDLPPTADIKILSPSSCQQSASDQPCEIPLFSAAALSGNDSSDPDDLKQSLTPIWTVYSTSDNSQVTIPTCPDKDKGAFVCTFTTPTPGTYRVELVVNDPYEAQSQPPAEQFIKVDTDQPPNIDIDYAVPKPQTSPDDPPFVRLASQDNTFAINKVEDDGDPYPPTNPAGNSPASGFVWYVRQYLPKTLPFDRWVGQGASFTVPANKYQPGDTIQVRGQYRDRVTACQPTHTPGCDAAFQACGDFNGTLTCYAQASDGTLHIQWVTWTVELQ
jgi:hypothetical protein